MQRFNLRQWGLISLSGIVLLGGVVASALNLGSSDSTLDRSTEVRVLPVKTTQVAPVESYSLTQTYTGEVTAARTSELGFERSGKLIWLAVDQGKRVMAGAAIAKLDTQNLETQRQRLLAQKAQEVAILQELQNGARTQVIAAAQAEVGELENQLELERIRRDRREYLYTEGAISAEQLDEVSFGQGALRDRLAAAQSRLDELQAGTRPERIAAQQAVIKQLDAEIADLDITIAKSTITAPFSGTVGERRVDEGTVVEAGQPVVRLVEGASPEVEIGVPAAVASQLEPGSQQQVQIGELTYQAAIASLKPEVNPTTRTRTVVLTLDPSTVRSVAPGQVARLQIQQTIPADGFWLPTTALVRGERGLWSCYVLAEADQPNADLKPNAYAVERRDVEVLHTEGDASGAGEALRVLVRGTIQPGDTVITDGTHRIVPGQLVQPIETQLSLQP
ncbi:efflux RND transporter periplasmic adaptor subunit [Leptolyngbya sp. FACHB-541]|uniref:efflux RND transporter periplasmic adaptor subunit n=1 Tax=Leptolyngbya sp. FACHB-541 TaxID=2692810 RepID=UPI001686FA6D|nr:efflux RND transporter periplasmic adaptor subunit [Leptolyngbya sp. FACHB-541]MBD2001089.1 efflux RND transporter periplasmic adaptor subunit [Leptolyngbya sp. FACHB-541]